MNDLIHLGAGPSFIPDEVKKAVIKEMNNFNNSGLSALEISHRTEEFQRVNAASEEGIRELLGVPDNFFVILLQGGATLQNTSIPLNFSNEKEKLGYIITGEWSNKTYIDGSKLRNASVLFDSVEENYTTVPPNKSIEEGNDCSLFFLTSNETINGVQIKEYNNMGENLIIDMSSDIGSRKIDWSSITCIYAGAQKNLGTSGVTIVVGDKSKLVDNGLTSYLNFQNHIEKSSLYNTPPVFSIVVLNEMLRWIKKNGGVDHFQEQSKKKALLLYDVLDSNKEKLVLPVEKDARSYSNVVFDFHEKETLVRFLKEAGEAKFHGINGHRSVGGVRVSIYNSIVIEKVEKIRHFINDFMKNVR